MKKVFNLTQRRRAIVRNKGKQLVGTAKFMAHDCDRPKWFDRLGELDEAIAQNDENTELCIKQNQDAAKSTI